MKSLAILLLLASPAFAQKSQADEDEKRRPSINLMLYHFAFNSEIFDVPCCDGFTLLGSQINATASLPIGEKAEVRVGAIVFVGSTAERNALEKARPVVSLIFNSEHNRFIMGTLLTRPDISESGPEYTGRHNLLPPLQSFALGIERGYENGLQFIRNAPKEKIDAWVNWQTLNTENQRETIDAGLTGRVHILGPLWAGLQGHIVHDGGQLFRGVDQPVSDSWAAGGGLIVQRDKPKLFLIAGPRVLSQISNELYVLANSSIPDRATDIGRIKGRGFLYRSTLRYKNFRGQIIRWWGDEWYKREGDQLYSGARAFNLFTHRSEAGPLKKYTQYGFFYEYRPTNTMEVEAGFRLHRSEISEPDGGITSIIWKSRMTTDYEYTIRAVIDVSFGL